MVKSDACVSTRKKYYSIPESSLKNKEGVNPFMIEKPVVETMPRMLKGTYNRALHNPNAIVSPNYYVVEDLTQTPWVMSTLEVLQNCSSQWNALLSALGNIVLSNDQVVRFDVSNVNPCLPYHVYFQIDVVHAAKTIGRTMIDEGTSTCVMAL